jgi:hypothetical protein
MGEARRKTAPVDVRHVPREAIEAALKIAGGDRALLQIEEDGTVTVLNQPREARRPPR